MKKAFIDQVLLGFFLFFVLIVLGATVADEYEARNKYYELKKITDNAAFSAGKYYIYVNNDTNEAETISNNMLDNTKLGLEVKDKVVYNWDFVSEPNTLSVSIPSYEQETFWFKFLDIDSFNLKANSTVEILENIDITQTNDLAPFGINGCDESHLFPNSEHTFDLRGSSAYVFDSYTTFYGLDVSDACIASGNSNWAHFKNLIKDFYVEDNTLKNDEDYLDLDNTEDFCIPKVKKLSMEQNNDPKQISQAFANLENNYDLVGVKMDMALFSCGSSADSLVVDKFIRVEFLSNPSISYDKVKNDYDVFQFDLKIIGTTTDKINLIK